MATTKEGTPISSSEIPKYIKKPDNTTPVLDLSIHPLDAYLSKSPKELQEEAKKLQKFAEIIKNHWTFVFIGLGLAALNYYRNYDTLKTLNEIKSYVRTKKK